MVARNEAVGATSSGHSEAEQVDNKPCQPEIQEALTVIDQMADRWPSTMVARKAVGRFTGYAYTPKTLQNADHRKCGPKGAFKLGSQKVYPLESITEWLKERVKVP